MNDPRRVRLLAMDSDGVLTDGGVYVFEDGQEFRRFDIKDGLGIKRVMAAGIPVAIISASVSTAVEHRVRKLGINEIHLGVRDKRAALVEICARLDVALDEVAYIGDDLPDLPILESVGWPCAPADAVPVVRAAARRVTLNPGGYGAVREICDWVLEAHNRNA